LWLIAIVAPSIYCELHAQRETGASSHYPPAILESRRFRSAPTLPRTAKQISCAAAGKEIARPPKRLAPRRGRAALSPASGWGKQIQGFASDCHRWRGPLTVSKNEPCGCERNPSRD